MHCNNRIPLRFRHGRERFIAQDPGISDEDMYASKGVKRGFDDSVAVFGGTNCCRGFPARYCITTHVVSVQYHITPMKLEQQNAVEESKRHTLPNLVNDSPRALLAYIIHNDIRTQPGIHERIGPSEPCTSAGDDGCFAVEANFGA